MILMLQVRKFFLCLVDLNHLGVVARNPSKSLLDSMVCFNLYTSGSGEFSKAKLYHVKPNAYCIIT
jgi:hypothetical protein